LGGPWRSSEHDFYSSTHESALLYKMPLWALKAGLRVEPVRPAVEIGGIDRFGVFGRCSFEKAFEDRPAV